MTLAFRIKRLEERFLPQKSKILFLMWGNCLWREAEGLTRQNNESIASFKARVLAATDKKFIWIR